MTTIVGQNIGANNYDRVREAVRKTSILSVIIGIIGSFCVIYFSHEIITSFTNDSEIISTAKTFFKVVTPTVITWGLFNIVLGVYQGAGFTKISMIISMIRLWGLRIPLVFILDLFIQSQALWYSMAISNYLIGVVSILFYRSNLWEKKNKLINI